MSVAADIALNFCPYSINMHCTAAKPKQLITSGCHKVPVPNAMRYEGQYR